MSSKFNKELEELVREKLISGDVAGNISQYYDQKQAAKPNRLFTIFGIFGALLVGSGIILMLAHNWDEFSRMAKTIIALVPLLIGQCVAGYTILKDKSKTWKEAAGTFLFFAVGSSISMVSQIYNIEGDLGSFLKTWTILCIPLIYLLRSQAVFVLVVLISTYYAVEVGIWEYRKRTMPWMYVLFIAAILPYYWLRLKNHITSNASTIFNWILPTSIAIGIAAFIRGNEELGFVMYMTLFGIFYNVGRLPMFQNIRVLRNGALIIGSLGTIVLCMIFTFRWPWEEISDSTMYTSHEFDISLFLVVMAILVLTYNIIKKGIRSINLFQISFLAFWGLFFLLSGQTIAPMILTNLMVFALGISAIKMGADTYNLGILNYGLLIVSVLIICRFFDTDMSFVVRGLLFVIVGASFFLANYILLKKQQKKSNILKN